MLGVYLCCKESWHNFFISYQSATIIASLTLITALISFIALKVFIRILKVRLLSFFGMYRIILGAFVICMGALL